MDDDSSYYSYGDDEETKDDTNFNDDGIGADIMDGILDLAGSRATKGEEESYEQVMDHMIYSSSLCLYTK